MKSMTWLPVAWGIFFSAVALFGQAQSGTVVGIVADQAGSVVPDANVTIVNDGTQFIPFVEKNFRTLPGRENRAIAGLSMGASIAANVGLKRLDVFASVGLLSAGMFRGAADAPGGTAALDQISLSLLADPAATNHKLRLFFLSCGTEDPRITALTKLREDLRSRHIEFTFKSYPGEHEWRVWRHSLADMAPLLFR